ncbi:retropepsin-like aspartic protease [Tunturiibacter lichenicola]|uniref:retropepsin-like aspartic protease n=1 Tax=Tunturiibacter lichenicola TaxID=2051959 RepID=UPI003D9B0E37
MKHLFSNRCIPLLVSVTMATVTLSTLQAESHCPAGIASVTPRFVQRALIVIPVRINQAGPFDFMVDTGSQVTVIDPSLAAELNLRPQGRVGLVSVASVAQASVTLLDRLEADSHVVEKSPAIVQDLRQIQTADPRIRGVLGESFLAHFDLLIDYEHKLLCLDETSAMRDSVRGEHVLFVPPQHPADELPFMERLVISVHLSGIGARAILLQLDSGSDGPILYAGSKNPEVQVLVHSAALQGGKTTNAQRAFAVVPPQTMQIGNQILSNISFVTPVNILESLPSRHEDGLLPTVLFQRVFISGRDHYMVFNPK